MVEYPNQCHVTDLFVVDLRSSLAYFMMTHPLLIAGKLLIETLVVRQLPTHTHTHTHTCTFNREHSCILHSHGLLYTCTYFDPGLPKLGAYLHPVFQKVLLP